LLENRRQLGSVLFAVYRIQHPLNYSTVLCKAIIMDYNSAMQIKLARLSLATGLLAGMVGAGLAAQPSAFAGTFVHGINIVSVQNSAYPNIGYGFSSTKANTDEVNVTVEDGSASIDNKGTLDITAQQASAGGCDSSTFGEANATNIKPQEFTVSSAGGTSLTSSGGSISIQNYSGGPVTLNVADISQTNRCVVVTVSSANATSVNTYIPFINVYQSTYPPALYSILSDYSTPNSAYDVFGADIPINYSGMPLSISYNVYSCSLSSYLAAGEVCDQVVSPGPSTPTPLSGNLTLLKTIGANGTLTEQFTNNPSNFFVYAIHSVSATITPTDYGANPPDIAKFASIGLTYNGEVNVSGNIYNEEQVAPVLNGTTASDYALLAPQELVTIGLDQPPGSTPASANFAVQDKLYGPISPQDGSCPVSFAPYQNAATQLGSPGTFPVYLHNFNADIVNVGSENLGHNYGCYAWATAATELGNSADFTVANNMVFPLATFDYAAPTVTSMTPTSGPQAGGTQVTIDGTGLNGTTAVDFGTKAGTIISKTTTQIVVDSPAGTPGSVNVEVDNPVGNVSAGQFTYIAPAVTPTQPAPPTVTTLTPEYGPQTGGTQVTITGNNLTGATSVDFGQDAGTIVSDTNTQIVVDTPAESVGPVQVAIHAADGDAIAGTFTFTPVTTPAPTTPAPAPPQPTTPAPAPAPATPKPTAPAPTVPVVVPSSVSHPVRHGVSIVTGTGNPVSEDPVSPVIPAVATATGIAAFGLLLGRKRQVFLARVIRRRHSR